MRVIVIRLLLGSRMKDMAIIVMLSVHSSIVLSVHVPGEGHRSSQRWIVLWHCCLRVTGDMAIGIFRMGHVWDAGAIHLGPPLKRIPRGGNGRLMVIGVIGSHSDGSTQ